MATKSVKEGPPGDPGAPRPAKTGASGRQARRGEPPREAASWIATVPEAQREAARELSSAVERLTRHGDALGAGRLVARAFESHLATASPPMPRGDLAAALLRGRVAREEVKLEEGGSLSASEAANKLGISKTALLKRYHGNKLLGWREARQGAVRFPLWQFTDDNVLPGLAETLAVLNEASWMDDWARVLFFLNRRASLEDRRPLDLLREGDLTPVLGAARAAVE